MKRFLAIISFFLFICLNICGQMVAVIKEEFNTNKRGWLLVNNTQDKTSIEHGVLHWEHKQSFPKYIWQVFSVNYGQDFNITTNVSLLKGQEYGIVWGAKDGNNCLNFTIKQNMFQVFEIRDGKWKVAREYIVSSSIQKKNQSYKN